MLRRVWLNILMTNSFASIILFRIFNYRCGYLNNEFEHFVDKVLTESPVADIGSAENERPV